MTSSTVTSRASKLSLTEPMPINAVVKRLGLTYRALRHYEELGLVRPMRDSTNARRYDSEAFSNLETIVAFRGVDTSLAAIAKILALKDPEARTAAAGAILKGLLTENRERIARIEIMLQKAEVAIGA